MGQLVMKQSEVGKILGGKARASEILNRKRSLSLAMIRALNAKLGISAETLIRETKSASTKKKPR
jgi:HTH-type transcriptional regulator / antitoxin HigA